MTQLLSYAELALARLILHSGGERQWLPAAPFLRHPQFYNITRSQPTSESQEVLQCTRHFLHFKALYNVAGLDILVALKGHAAFVTLIDLADLVLKTLQRLPKDAARQAPRDPCREGSDRHGEDPRNELPSVLPRGHDQHG